MASAYSNLKIQLMATGENGSTWGTVTNTNLGTAIEEAITGSVDVTFSSADVTLTLTDTNSTQAARHLRLNCTGVTGGVARNLILGAGCQIDKVYIVNNGCADAITIKNTTGTGIVVPAGKTMYVFNNGVNVVDAITHLTSLTLGSPLPVASGGTGATTLNGLTFTGENITNLNASNISSGTLANARTTASSSNGASTIVTRDASGNFSANTITANLTGTASNATVLQTARTIAIQDGVTGTATSFNGGANISIPVTGINASVIDTGTIANARTTASSSNGASSIVLRDTGGNFSANTVTANLTGTASNATVLQTARTIAIQDGVTGTATSFDGSGNISIPVTGINASVIDTGTIANARTTASSSNGASSIVLRDTGGNFSANTITANLTGTSSNATVLQNARNFSITGGATAAAVSFDGSGAVALNVTNINASTIDTGTLANARTTAASANGASTIVARDASGNFSANTITANLTGNASSATVLQTARNFSITGGVTASAVSFNGSGAVALNATNINASVIDTGTIANARTTASSANGASTIVARDASGNFSANTITATLSGSATSASTATTLANSRNFSISGGATANAISFNGSGDVALSVTGLNASTVNAGTLAVGNGGTGLTSVGTSGNVLSSNGSAWVSTFPQIYRDTAKSASGTAINFTGIPSTAKQIFVIFDSVSANASDNFLIQLGTSGGYITSGYNSSSDFGGSQATSTAGFIMQIQDGNKSLSGTMIISNITGNTWISSGNFRDAAALNAGGNTVGRIGLASTLTQLRVVLTASASYDAGTINIMYQ